MKSFKLRLKQDSRDKHVYMHFGQVANLNLPVNFDDPNIPEKIQPPGNIQCVLYTAVYIAQNKTKKEYDIDELYTRVKHYPTGTDIREVFGEIIKNGLLVKGTTTYEKPFSSYWRADTGDGDAFDNVRSAMELIQGPVAIASYWYLEWMNLKPNMVMPIGKIEESGHMYADKGWSIAVATPVLIGSEPMFIIEWWGGFTTLMPRTTFNEAMKAWGAGAWVLSDSQIDASVKIGWLTSLKDACTNVIILMKQLLFLKQVSVAQAELPTNNQNKMSIQVEKKPNIADWGNIIARLEGADPKLNNPGNLKYSPLIATWGATKAKNSDFAQFTKYEQGMTALCNFLTLGCRDQLIPYHNARTIKEFTLVYTDHPKPEFDYSPTLIKELGVTPDTLISTFLS